MFRLIALLLLFVPSCVFGQAVKMPAEIVATGKLVLIAPEFDKTPLATKFVVFGNLKAPEYASFGSTVLVAEPDTGDEVTVVCYALFDGNKLSDAAITKVKPRGVTSGTVPATPGTTPSVPTVDRDLPANATGISAIMVVDPSAVSPDINALATGSNVVTKALGKGQGAFYVRNSTDSLVAALKPNLQGKRLPVLIVIDSKTNPKKVASFEFTPAGNVDQTAKRIITMIANAVSP